MAGQEYQPAVHRFHKLSSRLTPRRLSLRGKP